MARPPPSPETVALPQAGGCRCGAVRFALTGAPLLAYACHCHDCQRRSGSVFSLTLVIHTADLSISGPTELRRTVSRAGREVDRTGCLECRSLIVGCATVSPAYASLRVGTLDDASWVVPIVQAWTESAIPWSVIPGVRQVDWADFDFAALGAEWQATAPTFRQPDG